MQIIIFALASIVAHSQFLPVNPFPNLTFVNPFKRSAPDAVVGFAIRCSSPRTWRNSPSSGLGSVCKEHPSPLSESDTCIMTRGTTIMDTFPAGAAAILVAFQHHGRLVMLWSVPAFLAVRRCLFVSVTMCLCDRCDCLRNHDDVDDAVYEDRPGNVFKKNSHHSGISFAFFPPSA